MKIEDAAGRLKGVAYNYRLPSLDPGLEEHPVLGRLAPLFGRGHPEGRRRAGLDRLPPGRRGRRINTGYSSELSAVGVDMAIRDYRYIEKKGQQMADVVLGALPAIKTLANVDIAIALDEFDYPLRDSYPVTARRAAAEVAAAKKNWRPSRPIRRSAAPGFSTRRSARSSRPDSGWARPGGSMLPRAARGKRRSSTRPSASARRSFQPCPARSSPRSASTSNATPRPR